MRSAILFSPTVFILSYFHFLSSLLVKFDPLMSSFLPCCLHFLLTYPPCSEQKTFCLFLKQEKFSVAQALLLPWSLGDVLLWSPSSKGHLLASCHNLTRQLALCTRHPLFPFVHFPSPRHWGGRGGVSKQLSMTLIHYITTNFDLPLQFPLPFSPCSLQTLLNSIVIHGLKFFHWRTL